MEKTTFYGSYQADLHQASDTVLAFVHQVKAENRCIEHITSRLKSPDSVIAKLEKQGHAPTVAQARLHLTDLVGVRLVCRFINDIYVVSQHLASVYPVVNTKDYIANPKPNGYRSYHMILAVPTQSGVVHVEIQLRTISQDAWACLEHQMKYKKNIHNEKMVRQELKRCADDLAATDLCMQTIREFIDMDEQDIWES